MSIQLQIAIPLFVTFAALMAIAIVRKFFRLETLVVLLSVLALGTSMTVAHFGSDYQLQDAQENQAVTEDVLVSLMLADQYMLKGLYSDAQEVLDDLLHDHGDDEDVIVASARCALLQGRYDVSSMLYRQVGQAADELEIALRLADAQQYGDNSTLKYLENKGYDGSALNFQQKVADSVDMDEVIELIRDRLHDCVDDAQEVLGDEAADAVKYAAQLVAGYADFVSRYTPAPDESQMRSVIKKFNGSVQSNVNLYANAHLRIARLKGCIAGRDYSALAKAADEYVTTQELIVLSQLISDGEITSRDFGSAFVSVNSTTYRKVLEACKETLEILEDELKEEEYDIYKEKYDELKVQLKEPVVCTLRQQLLDRAEKEEPDLVSKLYMALAKLEYNVGISDLVDEYVSEAISTAGQSSDANYCNVMTKLAAIITGTVDASEISNISYYVTQAVEHSLPLDVALSEVTNRANTGFIEDVSDDVNQSTAKLNIGIINADDFPNIQARIQIDSSRWTTLEELKENLLVYDCGSRIQDFTLEKMQFKTSRITLLCDVSGSMDDAEESLRQAIIAFAENMRPGEQVSVIGFNSNIAFVHDFTSDPEQVKAYADSIFSSGGTALYNSLIYTGNLYNYDLSSNNVIIAMTDGQDGNNVSRETMFKTINAMAEEKDLTVYTLGLGSGVNIDYLEYMAQCGNGSFLHVQNQEKLQEFYDFIHGQLANQYILSYTAKNETLVNRKLEISLNGELGNDSKNYSLGDNGYVGESSDAYTPYVASDADLSVSGLAVKFLYKNNREQTVVLKGSGFAAGDDVTVRLRSSIAYDPAVKFIDANTYELTIPADIVCASYDLEICVRGETFTLEDELIIGSPGKRTQITFGDYRFTSLSSYTNDAGHTVLTGNVVMNGWLCFKGDLELTSDLDGSKLWLNDESGFYVTYSDTTLTGLAGVLADLGLPLVFDPLGEFYITDDHYNPDSYESFGVQKIDYYQPVDASSMIIENSGISLYPNMLRLYILGIEYDLPFQKQLMQNLDIGGDMSGSVEFDALVTSASIAMLGEVEYKDDGDSEFIMVSIPMQLKELKVSIDTLQGNYNFDAKVKFKAIEVMDSMRFVFGVKNSRFDSIGLQADIDGASITLMTTPVPVTMNNFGFMLENFSQYESDSSTLSNLLATQIDILFDVNVASLDDKLPKLSEVLGEKDAALVQMSDCTLSLCLKEFRLSFDADVKLFSQLDVGECHITMGKFSYTNTLIGFYDETQYGLQASVTAGVNWESSNLDVDMHLTGEITVGYPYTGIYGNAAAQFDVGWWICDFDVDVNGDLLLGLYKNSSDNLQFSFILKGTDSKGDSSGFHLYVTRGSGLDIKTY